MSDVTAAIEAVREFRAAGVHAGLKTGGRLDFALIVGNRPLAAAGVFTTNQVKAAPVLWNQQHIAQRPGNIRALAINTVSANACTGGQGMRNTEEMARLVAEQIGCEPQQVLVMSTGVIGTHLPMDKIARGVELAHAKLGHDWKAAAEAIMTTDTRPKLASVRVRSSDGEYTIAGICKGSGMIEPNMATMLAVLVTDAGLDASQARRALVSAADASFNRIVVDGDTSTNDMAVLLASGASGVTLRSETDVQQFQRALTRLSQQLAQEVVRDGEGVTKFLTIRVTGAQSEAAAAQIARTIARSPLVKTAFYGNDANWGRIIAAAGRAGVPFEPERAQLWFAPGEALPEEGNGLLLFRGGTPVAYSETDATAIVREPAIYVTLDCGLDAGAATVWTCDLSHEYVSINADYRT